MWNVLLCSALAAEPEDKTINDYLSVRTRLSLPAAALEDTEALGQGVWNQPTGELAIAVTPIENLFFELSLFAYPVPKAREDWTPDFTYRFGWYDWKPYHFYLVHSGWAGTRYPWNTTETEPIAHPLDGITTGGWNYQWPLSWREGIGLPQKLWFGGSLSAGYAATYALLDGTRKWHHLTLSTHHLLTFNEHWFAEFSAHFYPIPGQQMPWDPDFTYAFGYMDWRPWSLTVRWNNYAGNRWPGRDLEGNGGFLHGALVVDFRYGFSRPGNRQ